MVMETIFLTDFGREIYCLVL